MKSKKELKQIKEKVEAVNEQLRELTDEELAQVTGGVGLELECLIQRIAIARAIKVGPEMHIEIAEGEHFR